jgi:alginate O-acetyltransferase complex protein AlgI
VQVYFSLYLIPAVLVAVPIYWLALTSERQRLWFLFLGSVGVLAILNPIFIALAIAIVVFTHQLVLWARYRRLTAARLLLITVTGAVVTLAIGKYGRSLATAVWGRNDWVATHLIMPLGISYFVFRLLQVVFDQLRGAITETSPLKLAAFIFFLPTFPAGPLETYQGFYGKRSAGFDKDLAYWGLRRIALGYFKKVVLGDYLLAALFSNVATTVTSPSYHPGSSHALYATIFVVYAFIHAYVDLSAYTDLALGFSSFFGFRIMENFHRPLLQRNLGEFWRSWHISLSSWCRNNVYFPVFGLTRKVWLGLYASMLTMGLWHYVNFNWAAWGLYHGTGLIAVSRWEKVRKKRFAKKWRKMGRPRWTYLLTPSGYVATFIFVALGYSFVSTSTITQGAKIFGWAVAGPFVWLAHHAF